MYYTSVGNEYFLFFFAFSPKVSSESTGNYRFIHSKNIQRPQLKFKDQPDNDSSVFIPRLREKPNAQQPLPQGDLHSSIYST